MKKTCSLSPIRRQAARCFSGFLSLFFCKLHTKHQRQSNDAGNPMKAGESQRSLRFFQRCRSHHDCIEGAHHHADDAVQRLGAEALQDYVGSYLADIMLRILVFVVLFLTIFILLRVLVFWLDLIAKLPILSGLNQIAGAVLGGLEGLVFVWIGCMILTLASGTGLGGQIMSQVDISPWLSWLYENNLLSYLVLGLLSLGIV